MNRREFLLLQPGTAEAVPCEEERDEAAVLSCERLYMRYVDAQADGNVDDMFARLVEDMRAVDALRLTDTGWLSCDDLRTRLDAAITHSGVRASKESDT